MVAKQKKDKKNVKNPRSDTEESLDGRFIAAVNRPQFQKPKGGKNEGSSG
jgi:hypothetical protein